jgi:hypothetical protein
MFFFGEAKDSAQMIIEERSRHNGPGWPKSARRHWDMRDTQAALIYSSSALRNAVDEGQPEELLNSLADIYEEHLTAFCAYSDVISRAMDLGLHRYPWHEANRKIRQDLIARQSRPLEK